MREDVTKHLELVQGVLSRMAGNSFLLKGWTVTIAAALFALAAARSSQILAILVLFPTMSFWGLDTYYLRQEKLFRKLYDELRLASTEDLRKVEPFSMSTAKYEKEVEPLSKLLWSPTIVGLHGVVVAIVLLVVVVGVLSTVIGWFTN